MSGLPRIQPPVSHASALCKTFAEAVCASELLACCAAQALVVITANEAFSRLFHCRQPQGRSILDFIAVEDRAQVRDVLTSAVRGRVASVTFRTATDDGAIFVEMRATKSPLGTAMVDFLGFIDVSKRIENERRLLALAQYDPLTDLPNRLLLQDRLRIALATAERGKHMLALLLVDLDGFKGINDKHGHIAGDAVLRQVARRLSASIREIDTVARLGGDEFVIVLPDIRQPADAAVLAARIINAVGLPIATSSCTVTVGASIGIALYPDDGANTDMLVGCADGAMYAAKRGGKNCFVFADSSAREMLRDDSPGWSPAFELGVPQMDREHAELFARTKALAHTTRVRAGVGWWRGELQNVLRLAARHFGAEERMMAASSFDGLAAHRKEHWRLLADLQALADHADKMAATLITRYLRNWLIVHIENYDKAAAACIRQAGAG